MEGIQGIPGIHLNPNNITLEAAHKIAAVRKQLDAMEMEGEQAMKLIESTLKGVPGVADNLDISV